MTDHDFIGKKVILFAASSSSPLGSSGSDLATMVGTGDWQEGQRLSSNASTSNAAYMADTAPRSQEKLVSSGFLECGSQSAGQGLLSWAGKRTD